MIAGFVIETLWTRGPSNLLHRGGQPEDRGSAGEDVRASAGHLVGAVEVRGDVQGGVGQLRPDALQGMVQVARQGGGEVQREASRHAHGGTLERHHLGRGGDGEGDPGAGGHYVLPLGLPGPLLVVGDGQLGLGLGQSQGP